jgi:hypothetical protein
MTATTMTLSQSELQVHIWICHWLVRLPGLCCRNFTLLLIIVIISCSTATTVSAFTTAFCASAGAGTEQE